MTPWYQSIAFLPILVMVIRVISPGAKLREHDPWHFLWDPLLALAAGVYASASSTFWFSRFHLITPVTSSDFAEYCNSVAALAQNQWEYFSRNRSVLLALLPGKLSESWGVLDGLALSSILSTGLIGAASYLWARALLGRMAGISAALFFTTVGALTIVPRTLSFYPELSALFALSGAGVALAFRWPGALGLLFGSSMVGLVLLADLRGLAFGLAHGGLLLVVVGIASWKREKSRIRWGMLYLLCLVGPIVASFELGPYSYLPETPPLEARMDVRQFFWERGYKSHHFVPPYGYPSRYVWGRTSITRIPRTLEWIREQREIVPEDWRRTQRTAPQIDTQLLPWLLPGLASALLGIVALRRNPRLIPPLLGAPLPLVAQLHAAATMVDFHERFLSSGMVFLPALLGVGWTVACTEPIRLNLNLPRIYRRYEHPLLRPAMMCLVLAVAVYGLLPTWLSPTAGWRRPFSGDDEAREFLGNALDHREDAQRGYCYSNLQKDRDKDPQSGFHFYP